MLKIETFPSDMSVFEVDKKHPRRCLVNGLFEERTESRKFYTYITKELEYNQPCVVVAVPDTLSLEEYLDQSPWLSFADKFKLFLHFAIPEGEWKTDGSDADYMNEVFIKINSRRSYVVMQDNIYAVGVARGATVANQAVAKMMSEWSGLVLLGDLEESTLIETNKSSKVNTGKTELQIASSKVQVPLWMFVKENVGVNKDISEFWKRNNDASDEVFSNKYASEIYFPSSINKKSTINEQKIAE